MTDLANILSNADFWVAVLRIATPLILGTLGVLLCERAGVLNLGIEGIMVAGAFTGWLAVYAGAPLWIGVAAAAATGAAFGLLHALLTVGLALSQHVSGAGHHIARDVALLLRLPRELSESEHAADRDSPFAPMDWLPVPVLGAQTALDLVRTAAGAARRLGAVPDAARPRGADGRREPAGRPRARACR